MANRYTIEVHIGLDVFSHNFSEQPPAKRCFHRMLVERNLNHIDDCRAWLNNSTNLTHIWKDEILQTALKETN